MPGYIDSDYAVDLTFEDEDSAALDISDWEFEMIWRNDKKTEITLELASGLSFATDGTDGALRIELTAAQMTQLGVGAQRIRLWRTDEGREMLAEGTETIEGEDYDTA